MTTPTPASAAAVITSFPSKPLTTPFARPSDCTGIYRSGFLAMVDLEKTCLPKGFKTNSDSYFSPGIACPVGYVSACHDNTGVPSITTVTCCPVVGDITLQCLTTSTLSSVWSTLFCTWIGPPSSRSTSITMTVSRDGVTSTITDEVHSPGGINAFGIRMVYQKTDLAQKPLRTGPARATSSRLAAASDASESQGLSTGAKAAIGVAVPVVVLALLAGVLLWWWRKRRRGQGQDPGYNYEKTEQQPSYHPELQGSNTHHVHEVMGSGVDPVELPAAEYRT
ncbi:hypothetical protein HIM_04093 [Hirsutella minnesotensis 3608]|uniref:Mid2 domain-containing protein n=1 Tax=Hirsutella minnesotensis 3608 TaxID=1043627 RepID=A0A0F8A630_9HYPO|nr:hypothetical protein HIM_04093 [Hirsutella minnesotensis 3608]